MKRINQWSTLLLTLFFSACGQETMTDTAEPATDRPTTSVCMSVQIDNSDEGDALTRVGGNGEIPEGYQLRYIMEVYTTADKLIPREVRAGEASYDAFTFENVRLPINDQYTAVLWADLVLTAEPLGNLYYNADRLAAIQQTLTGCTEADLLDAYSGKADFTIDADGKGTGLNVTLKRPLVCICLPLLQLAKATTGSYAIHYGATGIPTGYNAVTQTVITDGVDVPFRSSGINITASSPADTDFEIKDYVFMDNVKRQVAFTIYGNGTYYGKNNAPLHAALTGANRLLQFYGSTGKETTLTLEPFSPTPP